MACLRDPVTIGTKDNAFFLPQNGCPIVPIVTPHLSKSQAPREHRAEMPKGGSPEGSGQELVLVPCN